MDALLQTNLPNCHLPILLVNDIVFGGSDDGSNLTGIAATASGSSIFVIHECGHVLANLGDEYTSEFPGYPDTEEPNTTTQTNFDAIKWKAWINTNTTPIPTPETATYINDAGLFEGAHHHSDGWYRPQINCAMGNFSSPFCAVCSEALVLSFYRQVRPVDGFTPAATNLSLASPQMLTFTLKLVQPATHDLTVQWFTNGISSVGATNQSFAVELGLGAGGVTNVSARVKDETPLVRTDSENILAQTVMWNVNAAAPHLNLDLPVWLPDGAFSFRVTGSAPLGFVIESSTNFLDWTSIATNFLTLGEFTSTNSATASSGQFFRARTPP